MHIVLLILKIIGIILLVLLLLVLALVLIVLCTPVRYRIQGGYADDKPDVNVSVGIWFSLIAAHATFNDEGLAVFLKIFGVKKYIISPKPKTEGQEPETIGDVLNVEDGPTEFDDEPDAEFEIEDDFEPDFEPEEVNTDETKSDEVKPEDIAESENESDDEPEIEEDDDKDESEHEYDVHVTDTSSDENKERKKNYDSEKETVQPKASDDDTVKEKTSLYDKVMSIVDKIKGLYGKISGTVDKLKNLYHSLKCKEEAVMWFLNEKSTKHVIALFKTQITKVLKSILPKKLTGELTLGLDDPGTMGQVCMYAGIFYPMYEKHFKFTPVFNEKVIDGEVYVKGRIILGAIVAHFAKFLVVPDFYRTLKNVKILMRKMK